jgi:hypothetical protein
MEKSANKLWRESGTTLTFKEWINRENQKKEQTKLSFIGEQNVMDTVNSVYTNQPTSETNTSTVLGLNKGILIASSVLILGTLGYYFYQRLKTRR